MVDLSWPHVGLEVRNKRKRRGWTQAELGNSAGVSARTVTTLEAGKAISRANLAAIESALRGPVGPAEHLGPYVATEGDVPLPPGTSTASEADLATELRRIREALDEINQKLDRP